MVFLLPANFWKIMQALPWTPKLLESQVEVDISLSAFANARMHFDTKKKHAIKQQRTVDATERVSLRIGCSLASSRCISVSQVTLRPQSWLSPLPDGRSLGLCKCEAEVCFSDGFVVEGERKESGKPRSEEGLDNPAGNLTTTGAYIILHTEAQLWQMVTRIINWTEGAWFLQFRIGLIAQKWRTALLMFGGHSSHGPGALELQALHQYRLGRRQKFMRF
jgi:hypothetical protein